MHHYSRYTNTITSMVRQGDAHADGLPTEKLVEDADGFAEVFPEHKYRIVELLKERGHTVCALASTLAPMPSQALHMTSWKYGSRNPTNMCEVPEAQ